VCVVKYLYVSMYLGIYSFKNLLCYRKYHNRKFCKKSISESRNHC